MAVSAKWYGLGLKHFMMGDILWKASGGSTIKVMLLTSSATLNQDTDEYIDDVSANQVAGDGYVAGGAALTLADPAYTGATNILKLDANDVSWSASTITARYAIIYYDTETPATSPVIGYVDFGEDKVSSSGTFTITWDAAGIFKITAS